MRLAPTACLIALSLALVACGGGGGDGGSEAAVPSLRLASLVPSAGVLSPAFDPDVRVYTIETLVAGDAPTVAATPEDPTATLEIMGAPVAPGVPSAPIDLPLGALAVDVVVRDAGGVESTYAVVFKQAVLIQDAYVKAWTPGDTDRFGRCVAIDGDTLVVGTEEEDSDATGIDGDESDDTAPESGAVYVYVRVGGSWTRQAYIKGSNTEGGDRFGASIALQGDTLVVGAPGEDGDTTGVGGNQASNAASASGAVYVFTRTGGVWSQQAYVKASNTGARDGFGQTVALDGDTLVVGAPDEDSNAVGVDGLESDDSAERAGAVYVFTETGGVWTQQAYLKASNTEAQDRFGTQVAVSDDSIVVGAAREGSASTGVNGVQGDNTAAESGAAYVFTRTGDTWSQQAYLKASNADAGDEFGHAVAIDGDTIAIGAFREDTFHDQSGAVYVFTRTGGVWSQQDFLKASYTSAGSKWFGSSVALRGDALVTGAPNEDSSATGVDGVEADDSVSNSGAAYLFCRVDGVWSQASYMKAPAVDPGDFFGTSVALDDTQIAVGAINEDSSAAGVGGDPALDDLNAAGAAYVFR
ncbi:MAG: integrin [Planctomycetota bacterium]|nr:integrin [Planctomycetota bacterium]